MKIKLLTLVAVLMLLAVQSQAGPIPYPNVGTIAPTNTFTAIAAGDVTGYFVQGGPYSGGTANYTDFVGLLDVTTNAFSGWLFDNQSTAAGTSADFGAVNAGDTLVFELEDVDLGNLVLASSPAWSADGVNHVYATPWAGGTLNGTSIPAGLYLGAEDLPLYRSDLNYNDDSFVLANVAAVPTPEPDGIVLLGTGLLGLLALGRRTLGR